jgi:hypothetical protein
MKAERRSGDAAREVLTSMIVSAPVLAAVSARWDDSDSMFGSRYADLVGSWAVDYFRKYGKAPGPNIESVFRRWAAKARDEDIVKTVESFLAGLSGDYGRRKKAVNPDYATDLAARCFNLARYREYQAEMAALVESGDVESLDKLRDTFRPVAFGRGATIDVLTDEAAIREAFESRGELLFRWGQPALDEFFEDAFQRDSFVVLWATGEDLEKVTLPPADRRPVHAGRPPHLVPPGRGHVPASGHLAAGRLRLPPPVQGRRPGAGAGGPGPGQRRRAAVRPGGPTPPQTPDLGGGEEVDGQAGPPRPGRAGPAQAGVLPEHVGLRSTTWKT